MAAAYAKRILQDEREMRDQVLWTDRKERTITVSSCGVLPVSRLMPHLTQSFREKSILTEIISDTSLITRLKNRECQIAILHERATDPQIFTQHYCDEQLMISVPQHHPLVKRNSLKAEDLQGLSILMFDLGYWVKLCKDKMPKTFFMIQNDADTMDELVDASALFVLNFDQMLTDGYVAPERVDLPLDESYAKVSYFVACLDSEKEHYASFFNGVRSEVFATP